MTESALYIGDDNLHAMVLAITGEHFQEPPVRTPETMWLLRYLAGCRGVSAKSVVRLLRPWVVGARAIRALTPAEHGTLRARVNAQIASIVGACADASASEDREYKEWLWRNPNPPRESDPFDSQLGFAAAEASWKLTLTQASECSRQYAPEVWAAHAVAAVFNATHVLARRDSFVRGRALGEAKDKMVLVPEELVVEVLATNIYRVLQECFTASR